MTNEVFKRLCWIFIKRANRENTIRKYLSYYNLRGAPEELAAVMSMYNIRMDNEVFSDLSDYIDSISEKIFIKSSLWGLFFCSIIIYFFAKGLSTFWPKADFLILEYVVLFFAVGAVYKILSDMFYSIFMHRKVFEWIVALENRVKVIDFIAEKEKRKRAKNG